MIEQGTESQIPAQNQDRPSHIVARNTAIMLARQAANWIIALVLVLLIPRYLGDVGLGQLQFAQSFAALVSVGVGLGMGKMLTREIARSRADAQALLHTAFTVRVVASVIATGVVVVIVWLSGIRGESAAIVYVATAALLLRGVGRVGVSLLHGKEDMTKVAIADTIGRLTAAGIGIAVLVSGQGALAYAIALLIGTALDSVLVFIFANREMPIRLGFSKLQTKRLLTGAMPFAVTAGILTLYDQADTIMIRAFSGEAVLGWHSAAMRLVGSTEIIPAAIATALMPTLARTHVSDRLAATSLGTRAVAISAALLVPIAFVLGANSELIMDILPIPDVFENSSPVLTWLAVGIPVTAMLSIAGAVAAGSDRQKVFMIVMASGLIVNIALNAVMIPLFENESDNGGIGAAIATLISEVMILFIVFRVLSNEAFGRKGLMNIGFVAISAGVMLLAAWGGNEIGMHWSLWNLAALSVYTALIPLFRVVTVKDITMMLSVLKMRRRNRAA